MSDAIKWLSENYTFGDAKLYPSPFRPGEFCCDLWVDHQTFSATAPTLAEAARKAGEAAAFALGYKIPVAPSAP